MDWGGIKMKMHQIIAQHRRAMGLTQEQLAERLGVTAPAVNKWEKGSTCPDVALLPPLARLLGIDMNELFCFHEDLSDSETSRMVQEVSAVFKREGAQAAFTLAQKYLRSYPNCEALSYYLAVCLDGALMLDPEGSEQRKTYAPQIEQWYETLTQAKDAQIRNQALFMLAGRHLQRENWPQAQRMLDQIPEPSMLDKPLLQASLFLQQGKLPEAGALMARAILTGINSVQNHLAKLMEVEIKAGNDAYAERLSEISRQTAEVFEQWRYNECLLPLMLAVERQDAESALPLLDSLLESTLNPWVPEKTVLYHYIAGSRQRPDLWRMLYPLIQNFETAEECAFLRAHPDFQKRLSKYRALLEAHSKD